MQARRCDTLSKSNQYAKREVRHEECTVVHDEMPSPEARQSNEKILKGYEVHASGTAALLAFSGFLMEDAAWHKELAASLQAEIHCIGAFACAAAP
jgi:hypothetical protein